MIDKEKFKQIIAERKRIADETDDNWYDGIEACWKQLVSLFTANLNEGILFLENECTPEEIYWASEVFEDIAAKTQSKEFIAALHRIYDKMPEEVKKSIKVDIEFAELEIL